MNATRVIAVIALLASACSGSEDAAPVNSVPPATEAVETTSTTSTTTTTSKAPSTTTTTSTTTTSTTTTTAAPAEGTDEEQIAALIEQYWRTALLEASNPPNPEADVWAAVATPAFKQALDGNVQANLESNRGIEGANPASPFVLSSQITIIGPLAIAFVCVRDEGRVYDTATGETTELSDVVSSKRMEAINGDRGWLVDGSEPLETFGEAEAATCAESFPQQ